MGKRKLTRRQLRHIQTLHDERLARARRRAVRPDVEATDSALGPEQEGLVIARFGASVAVEDSERQIHRCMVRQNLGNLVCGDRVVWQATTEREGVVIAVLPRRSLLVRPDFGGRTRPLAANIEQIVVLVAPRPELSEELIDRYLVAAELSGITPLIVVNKVDLLDSTERTALKRRLRLYGDIGYRVLFASVRQAQGLDAVIGELRHRTSILVGQSGVGKSSVVNTLLPDLDVRVGELSQATGLGTHTTSRTTLYHLPQGGELIDSPGVREFGLWNIDPARLAEGFVEFRPFLGHCRFSNCSHRVEPGCALQRALTEDQISAQRLASYHKVMESLEQLERR
jgi:ribosome biogenesis GTPase / thiamine phosphate phosphatase